MLIEEQEGKRLVHGTHADMFLMSLCGMNKQFFGNSYRHAYLGDTNVDLKGTNRSHIFILLKDGENTGTVPFDRMLQIAVMCPQYVDAYQIETLEHGVYTMLVYALLPQFDSHLELFLAGKYSEYSDEAKEMLLCYLTKQQEDLIRQILYRDYDPIEEGVFCVRRWWEEKLSTEQSQVSLRGHELWSKPILSETLFDSTTQDFILLEKEHKEYLKKVK